MLKLINKVNSTIENNIWLKSIVEFIAILTVFIGLYICAIIYGVAFDII